ncbi:MAG: hypothetical protein Q7T71_19845 [Herbiconiux sp.]|nr:hypothetical protein [Herbiconiux sp.]
MEKTERDLRNLAWRVDRLEHLVVQVVCWAAAFLLVLGSLLAYIPAEDGSDADDDLPRLLTTAFKSFGYRDDDGNANGFSITLGIGFLGLMIVAAITLWLLVLIAADEVTERTPRVLRIALILLVIGTCVAGILVLVALGSDEADVGPGLPVFAAGVAASLTLFAPGLRGWWVPALRPERP